MDEIIDIGGVPHDTMREDVCEHCAFSRFDVTGSHGDCRANPPTPLIVPQRNPMTGEIVPMIQSVFPPVERRTYCFTFEPQDAVDPNYKPSNTD